MDTYKTISKSGESLLRDRGSRFLGFAEPCASLDAFKTSQEQLKEAHPKATHICYAYRIGLDQGTYRANDDGEPSGTAGKPILGQIDSNNLNNVAVFVVRYYGGTKLGTSGLIQAYKGAASEAITNSICIEKEVTSTLQLQFTYADMTSIMHWLKQQDLTILNKSFETDCLLDLDIARSKLEAFERELLTKFPNVTLVQNGNA